MDWLRNAWTMTPRVTNGTWLKAEIAVAISKREIVSQVPRADDSIKIGNCVQENLLNSKRLTGCGKNTQRSVAESTWGSLAFAATWKKSALSPARGGKNWTITFVRVIKVTNSRKCYLPGFYERALLKRTPTWPLPIAGYYYLHLSILSSPRIVIVVK